MGSFLAITLYTINAHFPTRIANFRAYLVKTQGLICIVIDVSIQQFDFLLESYNILLNNQCFHLRQLQNYIYESGNLQYCQSIRQATLPVPYALSLENYETGNMASPIDCHYYHSMILAIWSIPRLAPLPFSHPVERGGLIINC